MSAFAISNQDSIGILPTSLNAWTNLEDLPRTSRSVISVTFSLRKKKVFHVCLSKYNHGKMNSLVSIISVLTSTIAT